MRVQECVNWCWTVNMEHTK